MTRGFDGGLHFIQKRIGSIAPIHQFSCNQVHRLNAIGAFVNRGDTHVAGVLCGTCFFDISHATMHLNTDMGHLIPDVGTKGLCNGRQKCSTCRPFSRPRCMSKINCRGIGQCNRAGRENFRLHRRKHTAYVSMIQYGPRTIDDRAAPLFTSLSIGIGMLKRAFGGTDALTTNTQSCVVHHRKHCAHAVVRFAN